MTNESTDPMTRNPIPHRWRNWRIGSYVAAWLLLAIIVLQNLEPTQLDILFWSIVDVPKLVLVLGSMVLGVVLWEAGRLLASRSKRRKSH